MCHPKAVLVLDVKKRRQFVIEGPGFCGLFFSLRYPQNPLGLHCLLHPPKQYVLVSYDQTEVGDTTEGNGLLERFYHDASQSGSVAFFPLIVIM